MEGLFHVHSFWKMQHYTKQMEDKPYAPDRKQLGMKLSAFKNS